MSSFEARDLTKRILKNRYESLIDMRKAFKLSLFECSTIKADRIIQIQAERYVRVIVKQKSDLHALLACTN